VARDGGSISLAGGARLTGSSVAVPGDFSSAAFFIVAGCLAATRGLIIRGVGVNETRTGLLDMLALMGAEIRVEPHDQPAGTDRGHPRARERAAGHTRAEHLVPLSIDEFPVFFIAAPLHVARHS